jgi:hypothetical protein
MNAYWTSVAYAEGCFVAVGDQDSTRNPMATAAYSTDGSAWSSVDLPTSDPWESVAYGNGTFVAVAAGTSAAYSY